MNSRNSIRAVKSSRNTPMVIATRTNSCCGGKRGSLSRALGAFARDDAEALIDETHRQMDPMPIGELLSRKIASQAFGTRHPASLLSIPARQETRDESDITLQRSNKSLSRTPNPTVLSRWFGFNKKPPLRCGRPVRGAVFYFRASGVALMETRWPPRITTMSIACPIFTASSA